MKKLRVAIGVSSFSDSDPAPLETLRRAGVEVIPNPFGRRLTEDEVIRHLQGVNGVIAGLEPLSRNVLKQSPQLKAIARVGIGMDTVDLDAARDLGISVSNTPDAPTYSVAEMCLMSLLALNRNIVRFNQDMHAGNWVKHIGSDIRGSNVLLIGYGRIGRQFGSLLHVLGANLMVCDPCIEDKGNLVNGERLVTLTEGLAMADVISLHASGIKIILDDNAFKSMKRDAILLNSARAELVDEPALIKALEDGMVRTAWFDVFWEEPYSGRLTGYEQVLLTPHVSTYTAQCRLNMELAAVHNLLRDLEIH